MKKGKEFKRGVYGEPVRGEGEDGQRERARAVPTAPGLNPEKPGVCTPRTPGSHSQTHNPSLHPSGSSFLTLFPFSLFFFFKAVPAEHRISRSVLG